MKIKNKILQLKSLIRNLDAEIDTKASAAEVDEAIADIDLSTKQDVLVSGTNIKTVNSNSILGSGDLAVGGGSFEGDLDDIDEGTTNKHFTSTEKTKLSGIATGAEVNVNADWNAGSGDAQILNKPTILALGETSATAYRGDRGKTAYDYSQVGHLGLTGGTMLGLLGLQGTRITGIADGYDNEQIIFIDSIDEDAYSIPMPDPTAFVFMPFFIKVISIGTGDVTLGFDDKLNGSDADPVLTSADAGLSMIIISDGNFWYSIL